MPGFDGTGPAGNGAMSGRRMGHCSGITDSASENMNGRRFFRCGHGLGGGQGFARRGFFYGQFSANMNDELEALKKHKELIEKRIQLLEKADSADE